jgi:hypothetical protein
MDRPAEKWEFSLLVDQASRILEARGLFELYLGARANQITGRPLISFFDDSERLPFLRYMARLLVRGQAEPVSATLRTPAVGIKRFSMAAKAGDAGRSWWLLFAQDVKGITAADTLDSNSDPYATAQELDVAVRMHDHAAAPLDITLFRARAISDDGSSTLSPEARKEIDETLSRTLMDHASDRMVARPATGEYALLHDRNTDAAAIRDQLVAAAATHNIRPADLELVHETVSISADSAAASELIRDLRRKIRDGGASVVDAPPPAKSRRPIVIGAACALAVVVIGALAYARL